MDAPGHLVVDHIDRNGLNNRRSNLRLCSAAQNACNSGSARGSSSKYKGVCWNKREGKWVASIRFKNKLHLMGYFTDEIAAAKAYDKSASEFFGEFAYLNFPQ